MGDQPTTSIEGFELLERLGAGGFGTVYRGADLRHGRDVAIKVLPPMRDEAAERRFDRECRAMGTLSGHPNIAVVHTSGTTDDGSPYLAMELLDGGSLADRIQAQGPLAPDEAVALGVALCDGLAHAHAGGVLHLDMKPENVLYSAFGQPKIVDFGIAALVDDDDGTSTIRATPSFADPMVLDGYPGTASSDVYGIAATLYAALMGEPPYGSDGVVAVLRRIATEPVPRASRADVPDRLVDVLASAMDHDPSRRPAGAEALKDSLERAAGSVTRVAPGDRAPGATEPGADAGPTSADGRRRSTLLGAGMLVAAVAIFGFLLLRAGGDDESSGSEPTVAPSSGGAARTGTAVVPDVTGRSVLEAERLLGAAGLIATSRSGCGEVQGLQPPVGDAAGAGDTIELLLEPCRVPDFVGLRLEDAIATVEAYPGLTISWPAYCGGDTVIGQEPTADTVVVRGTDIALSLPDDC